MDHEIIRINENSWRIEDGGVRMFLLTGSERALLIDSGMNIRDAKDIAQGLTSLPLSLLNTHADIDHIGSNGQFDEFYMHPADEPQYRGSGGTGKLIPVGDGDVIDLGNREIRVIHIPGHTPGSIALLDVGGRVLISGDTVQEHGRIFMFGGRRDMDAYIKSLDRLEGMNDLFGEIWPSHADMPVSPNVIPKLRAGALDILAGRIVGKPGEMRGRRFTVYDLGFCVIFGEASVGEASLGEASVGEG